MSFVRINYIKNGERLNLDLTDDDAHVMIEALKDMSDKRKDLRLATGRMYHQATEVQHRIKDIRTALKRYFNIETDEDSSAYLTRYNGGKARKIPTPNFNLASR